MTEATDFRDQAVSASQNLLRKKAKPGPEVTHAGISYCLPGLPNGASLRAGHRTKIIIMTALTVLFALGGGAIIALGIFVPDLKFGSFFGWAVGGGLILLGISFLALAPAAEKRFVESTIREGAPAIWQDMGKSPRLVRIENTETYNKFKFVADDFGALVLHNDSRCVQIEGVTHRYLIYGADVVAIRVNRVEPTESFNISYQVGGQRLDLTLIPMQGQLLAAIEKCLGVSR